MGDEEQGSLGKTSIDMRYVFHIYSRKRRWIIHARYSMNATFPLNYSSLKSSSSCLFLPFILFLLFSNMLFVSHIFHIAFIRAEETMHFQKLFRNNARKKFMAKPAEFTLDLATNDVRNEAIDIGKVFG